MKNIFNQKYLSKNLIVFIMLFSIFFNAKIIAQEDISVIKPPREIIQKVETILDGKEFNLIGIAIFDSNSLLNSLVQEITSSGCSHAGLILSDTQSKELYCLESTGGILNTANLIMPSVEINQWNDVVSRSNNHEIFIRWFTFKEGFEPKSSRVTDIVHENLGSQFADKLRELVNSVKNQNDTSDILASALCSVSLVSEILVELGYLDASSALSQEHLIHDFSKKDLPLINATLSASRKVLKKTNKISCGCFGI